MATVLDDLQVIPLNLGATQLATGIAGECAYVQISEGGHGISGNCSAGTARMIAKRFMQLAERLEGKEG